MSSLYTVKSGVLEIKDQTLDQTFVDDFDSSLISGVIRNPDQIHTISLEKVQLVDTVYCDICQSFVNLLELNVLNSRFNSKTLYSLLRGTNPYSLRRLDLSGSMFDSFNEEDLKWLNGLFSVSELILPENMDVQVQLILKKVLRN